MAAAEQTAAVVRELTATVVIMDSLEEAEMVKLINNSFRDLSFAFANELAMICQPHNLDAGRIIRAANDGYPRNPIPLPSPGVGGPCLTKDPYFYAAMAKRAGLTDTLAAQGRKVNERITVEIASRVVSILGECGVSPQEARVLIVGLAFKGWPETPDVRNSSSLIALDTLRRSGVTALRGIDPVVPIDRLAQLGFETFSPDRWKDAFRGCHAVLFMNNHPVYRKWDIYEAVDLMARPAVVFDGWQIVDGKDLSGLDGVHVLGLGAYRRATR
jgi:nucleotide sugar dehydrogenase